MSQPFYFLSEITRAQMTPGGEVSRDLLQRFGLNDLFDDAEGAADFCFSEVTKIGPDGKTHGLILAALTFDNQPPDRMGFYPDGQEWKPSHAVADGKLWIGLDKVRPTRPNDLRRKTLCSGYDVKLEDGYPWQIPIIRRVDGQTELPQVFSENGDGQWRFKTREKYMAAWKNTEISSGFFFFDQSHEMNLLLDICIEALAINYRIDKALTQRLEILGSGCWESLLSATVDFDKVLAIAIDQQKKNLASATTQDSANCTPGQPAGSLYPTQAAENSGCDRES